MTNKKTFPAFDPTITAQTKDGATVEIGSIAPDFSVKIFPENMHITTGCIDSRKFRSELDK